MWRSVQRPAEGRSSLSVYRTQIFNLDSRPLKEVFGSVLDDDDPAKCRNNKKHEPKEPPEKPHFATLLLCRCHGKGAGQPGKARARIWV
jgi:hypothetical protein